jgi:hypothetical protein
VSPAFDTNLILLQALKRYNILDDWRQYALYIVHGDQERCLGLEEKPLLLFKQLDKEGRKPMFMLRRHASPQEGWSGAAGSSAMAHHQHTGQHGHHGQGGEGAGGAKVSRRLFFWVWYSLWEMDDGKRKLGEFGAFLKTCTFCVRTLLTFKLQQIPGGVL